MEVGDAEIDIETDNIKIKKQAKLRTFSSLVVLIIFHVDLK